MSVYLVVAHQTATSPELRACLESIIRTDADAEFFVLVPETPVGSLLTWDERDAEAIARDQGRQLADTIVELGGSVDAVAIGQRGVTDAVLDEIRAHPEIESIVMSTFPGGISSWLGLDAVAQTRRRTGLPVTHVIAPPRKAPVGSARARTPAEKAPAPPLPGTAHAGDALPAPPVLRPRPYKARLPASGDAPSHLLRALAHNPAAVAALELLGRSLVDGAGISTEAQQLIRLRVALHAQSEYLWHDAVREARRLGLSDDRIFAVEHWYASERIRFSDAERALLRFVDEATHRGRVSDRTWSDLRTLFPDPAIVGIATTVADARAIALLAAVFAVSTEEQFVGWDLY